MEFYSAATVFLPLLASLIGGYSMLVVRKEPILHALLAIMLLSCMASWIVFFAAMGSDSPLIIDLCQWFEIAGIKVDWSLHVDQLTTIMWLLVTTVSTVVHIYSYGYMQDYQRPRFLSLLSLFTFFMLMLVASGNFIQLFFGWEGVGLCSYLLIGFYNQKDSANNAALKAFIVNRFGDAFLLGGIIGFACLAGSVEFASIFPAAQQLSTSYISGNELLSGISQLDLLCFCILVGCMSKSAQIGLHVWLPDAMEGPSPVSALIHAATMVTAGVFLLARCSPLLEYSPQILNIIAIIGAITCLFGALTAICQSDIKKIIAYSTCSQLGYMFLGIGVSAYQAAIFHLFTHGFFKALLFLGAGNVIHQAKEQDIYKLGGLKNKMPITYIYFLIGSIAISGIFPLAGFYSKDAILESTITIGRDYLFYTGLIGAMLTAAYSAKILYFVFLRESRDTANQEVTDPGRLMTVPLLILAAGSLFSGMMGYYILKMPYVSGYFRSSIFNLKIADVHDIHLVVKLLPIILSLVGILVANYLYRKSLAHIFRQRLRFIYIFSKSKWYFDEVYNLIAVGFVRNMSYLFKYFDRQILDYITSKIVELSTTGFSVVVCRLQNCPISVYSSLFGIFAFVVVTFLLGSHLGVI